MFYCPNCNNIYDIKQISDETNNTTTTFFVCENCGHKEEIKEGTLVASKYMSTHVVSDELQPDLNILNDPTIPITRNYKCPNKKCSSYTDPEKREALFYRTKTNNIIYICRTCKTVWT
jgi:DNA-directed RNA polymerase subunit M/transcription elongation factor TFIIS